MSYIGGDANCMQSIPTEKSDKHYANRLPIAGSTRHQLLELFNLDIALSNPDGLTKTQQERLLI